MDPTSSSLSTPTIPSILEFCDNGHTFIFPHDQLPKHKIFISHSGKQKNFAEQLCEDLERWGYYPFFDKRPHSLPKGENFPSFIFEATRECYLAIVLLSEDFFTRSKWPMLELASFVEAKKSRKYLRIVPVLLDLHMEDLKDTGRWSEHWENWVKDDPRLDGQVIKDWEIAIKYMRSLNMIMQSGYEGKVALRKAIVQAVVESMPPDIQSSVVHVQGKERLYKEIASRFSNIPRSCSKLGKNAKMLGVYGIAGAGKSTLCIILTYFLRREFQGRVCHVEFDEGVSTVKLQHQALQQLTGANQDYLNSYINSKGKGSTCLMERIPRQRVFLALDNVSDIAKSLEVAEMFLEPSFYPDSMVLVTSRSKDVLHTRLGIPESCCMPCPQVNAQEASKIVLDHLHISSTEILTEEERNLLQQTLDSCNFESFGGFHPLSLKVLASQMGCNPPSWKLGDLQEASDIEHPLFSAIETNFSRLPDQQTRDIFMDIALFRPESVNTVHDISLWLDDTLHDIKSLETKLRNLRMKSLLEFWSLDADIVRIHDLHRELAKRMATVEGISHGSSPRFVYQKGGEAILTVFSSGQQARHIERAGFVECSFTTASFEKCSNLKRLCIRSCKKIETLSLDGLLSLVSLEVFSCQLEQLKLKGLVSLRWLCVDSCCELLHLDVNGLEDLRCIQVSRCSSLLELELADCNKLKSLSVSYNASLMRVDLGSGQSLHFLTLWFCEGLTRVRLSESTKVLSEFRKRGCPKLLNIEGHINVSKDVKCLILTRWQNIPGGVITSLAKSRHLRVLDLWDCPVHRLPDLRNCSDLFELRLSDVDVLLDSADTTLWKEYATILTADDESLQLPVALEDVRIASCRNAVVKEICWKLQSLKNLTVLSMQRVRVAWDWELFMPIEQKGSNASFNARDRTSSISEAEIPMKALHLDKDMNRKAEVVNGEEEEEERSCKEASSDNADLLDDGDILNQGDSSSEGLHQGMGFEVVSCVRLILYWVQEYLENTAKDSPLEREVYKTFQFYKGENMADPSIVVSEDAGLFWERMIMTCDRIWNLQFSTIEQTLLETCDSCDSACVQICKRLSVKYLGPRKADTLVQELDSVVTQESMSQDNRTCLMTRSDLEKLYRLINKIQGVSAEELKAQLDGLEAIRPQGILKYDDLETWEEEIIHELGFYENVRSCQKTHRWENRLSREGIFLSLSGVDTLRERLKDVRGWGTGIATAEVMKKRRRDWLRSCKICILIEQFLCLVGRQGKGVMDKDGGSLSNFQWLGEVLKKIDLLLEGELDNIWSLNLSAVDDSQVGGMLRGWKTRQWLQMVVSCLSQDFADAELEAIIKAKCAELFLPRSNPMARGRWELTETINDMFAKVGVRMRKKRGLHHRNVHLTRGNGKGEYVDLQENPLYVEMLSTEIATWTGPRYSEKDEKDFSRLLRCYMSEEHMKDIDDAQCLLYRSYGAGFLGKMIEYGWRFGKWVEGSENLAEKLRVHLGYIKIGLGTEGEATVVVEMWERALELAEDLAAFADEWNLDNCHFKDKAALLVRFVQSLGYIVPSVKVQREMERICEWLRGMHFSLKLDYMMKVELEVLQLCASAIPKTRQNILYIINKQEDMTMLPEDSEFLKLIKHFQIMEEVHWKYVVAAKFNLAIDGVAQLKWALMERAGYMGALVPYHQQQEIIFEENELSILRKAKNFPLRRQWININRNQNFILPITHCTKLCHLQLSNCKLKIPSSYNA